MIGTGGASHYSFGPLRPNSEGHDAETAGVLELTLHPTGYDWQFLTEPGKSFTDSGNQSCH